MSFQITGAVFKRLQPTTVFQKEHNNVFRGDHQFRYLLNNRETNGLVDSGAVITIGNRMLIDPVRFYEWLESKQKPLRKSA